jgi:Uma2 family endonuclease
MITAEQLLEMPRHPRVELVKGEIVEMSPVERAHSYFVTRLLLLLAPFVEKNNLGFVGPEAGYVLSRDPDTVRAPDLGFISAGRMGNLRDRGYFDLEPDLAIEILSPNNRPGETHRKIADCFGAGTRLVWVIDPSTEQVIVHHPDGRSQVYSGDDEVSGEDVLPGFSFTPLQLFS